MRHDWGHSSTYLSPPRRIYYNCHCLSVCLSLCLSVCQQLCAKSSERICMKFSETVSNGPVNKWLNFGVDSDYYLDTGIVSGFVTITRYGKWLTDINMLLILIRQMAALVRRALAQVCTVPVLLVVSIFTDVRCGYNWNALEFVRDLYFVTESRIKSIRLPVSELFRLACT